MGRVTQVIELCPKLVNLFILGTPKCARWQTVETEMKVAINQCLHCLPRQKRSSEKTCAEGSDSVGNALDWEDRRVASSSHCVVSLNTLFVA